MRGQHMTHTNNIDEMHGKQQCLQAMHTHLPNTNERACPVFEAVVRWDRVALALAARPKKEC